MDDFNPFDAESNPFIEQLRAAQKQQDMNRMNSEIISHEIYNLFDSLDEQQLNALNHMFNSLTQYKDPQALLGMYYGLCLMARKHRFDICIACGKSHNEQLGLT